MAVFYGGSRKIGGIGQFADLRGGLAKRRWVVFLREVDTPMRTMSTKNKNLNSHKKGCNSTFYAICYQCYIFIRPENIRKP